MAWNLAQGMLVCVDLVEVFHLHVLYEQLACCRKFDLFFGQWRISEHRWFWVMLQEGPSCSTPVTAACSRLLLKCSLTAPGGKRLGSEGKVIRMGKGRQ